MERYLRASLELRAHLESLKFRSSGSFNNGDYAILEWLINGREVLVDTSEAAETPCREKGPYIPQGAYYLRCELSTGHYGDHREGRATWQNKPLTPKEVEGLKDSLLKIRETLT